MEPTLSVKVKIFHCFSDKVYFPNVQLYYTILLHYFIAQMFYTVVLFIVVLHTVITCTAMFVKLTVTSNVLYTSLSAALISTFLLETLT